MLVYFQKYTINKYRRGYEFDLFTYNIHQPLNKQNEKDSRTKEKRKIVKACFQKYTINKYQRG